MNEKSRFLIDLIGIRLPPETPVAVRLVLIGLVLAAFAWSIVWILRDSEQRGKSGLLAFLFLVAAGWPASILWWLWLRPPIVTFKFHRRETLSQSP